MVVDDHGFFTLTDDTAFDPSDPDAPDIIVIVDGRDEELQRRVGIAFGGRNVFEDRVKKRIEVLSHFVRREGSLARSSGAEEHRGIELFVGRVEIEQEFEDLIRHLVEAGVGTVDLVHDDDDPVSELHRLAEHEARLGHGTFRRIHEEDDAVHHFQDALHFAAEIRVAGGIDDIDLHAVPDDGGVLCKDGDAAFPFEIAGVHDALPDDLILMIGIALLEHLIDQRGLAVVDVRDDRNIAEVFSDQNKQPVFPAAGNSFPIRFISFFVFNP